MPARRHALRTAFLPKRELTAIQHWQSKGLALASLPIQSSAMEVRAEQSLPGRPTIAHLHWTCCLCEKAPPIQTQGRGLTSSQPPK